MSINELLVLGLIKLAKVKKDQLKVFQLYNILSKRFDISAKVMQVAKQIIGKVNPRMNAFRFA